jgi:hypothetical protein
MVTGLSLLEQATLIPAVNRADCPQHPKDVISHSTMRAIHATDAQFVGLTGETADLLPVLWAMASHGKLF